MMLEYCSVVHLSLQVVAVRPGELMSLPTEFLLLLFLNPKVVDCSTRSVSPQATASTRSVHSYRPNQKNRSDHVRRRQTTGNAYADGAWAARPYCMAQAGSAADN